MTRVLQTLVGALTIGGVYAVIAVSLNLVMTASNILNLAASEFAVLGALVTIELHSVSGWPLPLAIGAVLVAAFILGILEHDVALRAPRRGRTFVRTPFVITLGVALLMRGFSQQRWGRDFYGLKSFTGTEPVRLGSVSVPTQSLWVFGTAIVVSAVLYVVFTYTFAGKAFRSCAENREAARLVGINATRVTRLTFGVGAVLAAFAGIVIAPITFVAYGSGIPLLLNGFIAAAIGGFGKTSGAIAGGVLVGLLTAFVSGYVSSLFADAVVFAILLAVLVVRPAGLLGSAVDVAQRA